MNKKYTMGKHQPAAFVHSLAKTSWISFAATMILRTAALFLMLAPCGVQARDTLGIFEGWGAFRDPATPRCYAIAEPVRRSGTSAEWRAFASVGNWPRQGLRGQINIRLSRPRGERAPVSLAIGDRRFTLTGGGADIWAPDRQADAAIVAAIRSGTSMSIESRDRNGRAFADSYALKGAATAIDAAALGCARLR